MFSGVSHAGRRGCIPVPDVHGTCGFSCCPGYRRKQGGLTRYSCRGGDVFFHDVMATSWKKGIPFGMHRKKKILSWRTGRKGNAARFFHRSELVVDTDLDTGYAVIIVFVDFGDFLVFEVGIGELSIEGCPFGQAVKITDAVFFGVA